MIARKKDLQEDHAEKQFIHRLKRYDERAWAEMFERFDGLIYKIAGNCLPSSQVPDLMQDVRMGLFRSVDKYDSSKAALVTWVMLLTKRRCIDYLRKNRRAIKYGPLEEAITNMDSDSNPAEKSESEEALNAVDEGVKKLTPDQQKAFYLAYKRGFTFVKAAEELQVPLGTFKTFIYRGSGKLKQKLRETYK